MQNLIICNIISKIVRERERNISLYTDVIGPSSKKIDNTKHGEQTNIVERVEETHNSWLEVELNYTFNVRWLHIMV